MYTELLRFLKAALLLTFLALAALATLHLLGIPRGDLVDWIVGVLSVWWLLLVTTVPWNIHFEASAALQDAATAEERGIEVKAEQLSHIRTLARRALHAAIVLHLLTAAGLYAVARLGWSEVGYTAAVVALGLTFLRPAARAYAYLAEQLRTFRKEVHYPREDVVELRSRLRDLEQMLDLGSKDAWAHQISARLKEVGTAHLKLDSLFQRANAHNTAEHARLEQEYRTALATVTEDRQFVEHLREIVRFVRSA